MKGKKILAIFMIILLLFTVMPMNIMAADATIKMTVNVYEKNGGSMPLLKVYTFNITQEELDVLQPLTNIDLTTALYNNHGVLADLKNSPISQKDIVGNGKVVVEPDGITSYQVNIYLKQGTVPKLSVTFATDGNGTLSGTTTFNGIQYNTPWSTAVSVPTPVAHEGYTFASWTPSFPSNVTQTATYTATFSPIAYTINYVLDGGSNDARNPTTYNVQSGDITLYPATKLGYTFQGWYPSSDFSGAAVNVLAAGSTGNKTFYAKWQYDPNQWFTIHFTADANGSLAGTTSYTDILTGTAFGTAVTALPTTTANAGYEFAGWTPAIPASSASVTANATYQATFAPIAYNITYVLNGGVNNSANPATYTIASENINLLNPSYFGYIFQGWYSASDFSGSAVSGIATGSTGDKTFYAKWTKDNALWYSITFTAGANGSLNGITNFTDILSGTQFSAAVVVPTPVANEGYCFDYWSPALPTGDTAVMASKAYQAVFAADENNNNIPDYKEYFDVTFAAGANGSLNGTTSFAHIQYGTAWTTAVSVPATTADAGYKFNGWTPIFPSKVTQTATYTANFVRDEGQWHDITFVADINGTLNGTTNFTDILSGTQFGAATVVPTPVAVEGYCFDYWSPALPTADAAITKDAVYRAYFATDENGNNIPDYKEPHYTVTFTTDGNGTLSGTTVYADILTGLTFEKANIVFPLMTANAGYTNGAWTLNGAAVDQNNFTVTGDMTFTATFTALPPAAPTTPPTPTTPTALTPAAPAAPIAPATAPVITITAAEVPLAAAQPAQTTIEEAATPLAAQKAQPVLALVNLASMILTVLGMIYLFTSRKNDRANRENTRRKTQFIGLIIAAVSAILFFLTEPLVFNFRMVDEWTVLMIVIAAVQALTIYVTNRRKEEVNSQQA